MAQARVPIVLRNFNNGVVLDTVVDEYVAPEGSCSFAMNVHFDRMGAVQSRPGTTRLGGDEIKDAGADVILGLHQFLDEGAGTDNQVVAGHKTKVYYLNGSSAWTPILSGLTDGKKQSFNNFLDYVWFANGTDATRVWNGNTGSSFVTTGNALDAPIVNYLENFRSRMWGANNPSNPSRVYYSSVPTAGTVLWTGSDSGYIDVAPGDGEDIAGVRKFSRALHVFKNNFTYRIYSVDETEPDPQIFVGTYSNRSISLAKDGMYWHHSTGIYRLRKGEDQPTEISKPIDTLIRNIPISNYTEIVSWVDADHVYFWIGDQTINDRDYTDVVIRWTVSTEVWTIYSYPTKFTAACTYNSGAVLTPIVGDENGQILTFNSGESDYNSSNETESPINYSFETNWENLNGYRSYVKTVRAVVALHENATGAAVTIRSDKQGVSDSDELGTLKEINTGFRDVTISGSRFKMGIRGSSTGDPLTFQGFEITDWTDDGRV